MDDGEYTLTETATPTGYNTIEPITFNIVATHKDPCDGSLRDALTTLTGTPVTGEITLNTNLTNGSLTTDIVNNAGTTLPGTGGIGTTIFYIIGGGLMIAAAVLLITKKRMENKN